MYSDFVSSEEKWINAVDWFKYILDKNEDPKGDEYHISRCSELSKYFWNTLQNSCGFCAKFHDTLSKSPCNKCPLYPEFCAHSFNSAPEATFWRLRTACMNDIYYAIILLAEQMLTEIRKHEDKFRD